MKRSRVRWPKEEVMYGPGRGPRLVSARIFGKIKPIKWGKGPPVELVGLQPKMSEYQLACTQPY